MHTMMYLMFRELRHSLESIALWLFNWMFLQSVHMIYEFVRTCFCGLLQSFKEFLRNPLTRWTKTEVADKTKCLGLIFIPRKFVKITLQDAAAMLVNYKSLKTTIGNFRDKWKFLRYTGIWN